MDVCCRGNLHRLLQSFDKLSRCRVTHLMINDPCATSNQTQSRDRSPCGRVCLKKSCNGCIFHANSRKQASAPSLVPRFCSASVIISVCVQTGRLQFMAVFKLHTGESAPLTPPLDLHTSVHHLSDVLLPSALLLLQLGNHLSLWGRSDLLTQTKA